MGGTVTIFDPQGNKGDIPYENLAAAVKAGAKPSVAIKDPQGNIGDIPADQYQAAVRAGGTVVPLQDQQTKHPGFWATAAEDMKGLLHPSGFSPYPGMDTEAKSDAANQSAQQDQARKDAGYSLPYRAAAPVAQAAGVNVPGMEESAKEGDVAGVMGHAAAPVATLAAGEAIAHGAPAIADALPSADRAGQALERVKAAAGNVPIDTAKPGNTALDIYTQSQRGATLPTPVSKLVRRLTTPGSDPMTYAEAKDFQSNISKLSANEKMNLNPNTQRLVGQLNADLKESLQNAAHTAGMGSEFAQAMHEYRMAMKLKGASDAVIDAGWKAALSGAGLYGAKKVIESATGH